MAYGAHDHLISIQVCADETYDHPEWGERNIFRFVTVDGNGKYVYSTFYQTEQYEEMYGLKYVTDGEEYRTREECNDLRKQVRKQLQAVAV